MSRPTSIDLARQGRDGDTAALDELIVRHRSWIESFVRRRLNLVLRRKGDTMDFTQEALMRVLRYGPRIAAEDDGQFRALLAKIVENQMRDAHEFLTAGIRDVHREVSPGTRADVGAEDARRASTPTPSADAIAGEEADRLELALELLGHRDRLALRLREQHGRSFAEIGRVLSVGEDGARKRYDRAVLRARKVYEDIEAGRLRDVLAVSMAAPYHEAVDTALRRAERDLTDRLSKTVGDATRDDLVADAESVDRARRALRSVAYDLDEDAYLRRAHAALHDAAEEAGAAGLSTAPFEVARAALGPADELGPTAEG